MYSSTKLKAIPFLEKAIQLDANVDPQIHYVMGKAYHLDMQWDKAIAEFKKFQSTITKPSEFVEIIEDVNKHIEECNTGKDLVKNPIRVFIDNVYV